MITRRLVRSISALLCTGLLLTGCGSHKDPGRDEPEGQKAEMGRYVEEVSQEYDVFSRIGAFTLLSDGTLEAFDHNYGFFLSDDNGKSWKNKTCAPVEERQGKVSSQASYLAYPEGVYRHTIGGGTVEKLLEGTLFSIGYPTNSFWGMQLLKDNEFLIQLGNCTSRMYYDPNMSSVPERTLRVFSMEKDLALQRAVNLFQRKHQDIYVQYETGLTGTDAKTREDVIKSLNTEIMAGNGPDIISLAELPIDSYRNKGMLEDITSTIEQVKKDGDYFENILEAY